MEKDIRLLCYEDHVFGAINSVLETYLPREFASSLESIIWGYYRMKRATAFMDDDDKG